MDCEHRQSNPASAFDGTKETKEMKEMKQMKQMNETLSPPMPPLPPIAILSTRIPSASFYCVSDLMDKKKKIDITIESKQASKRALKIIATRQLVECKPDSRAERLQFLRALDPL